MRGGVRGCEPNPSGGSAARSMAGLCGACVVSWVRSTERKRSAPHAELCPAVRSGARTALGGGAQPRTPPRYPPLLNYKLFPPWILIADVYYLLYPI